MMRNFLVLLNQHGESMKIDLVWEKKYLRSVTGKCPNCGHSICICKIPKGIAKRLPQGFSRKGTKGIGHPKVPLYITMHYRDDLGNGWNRTLCGRTVETPLHTTYRTEDVTCDLCKGRL